MDGVTRVLGALRERVLYYKGLDPRMLQASFSALVLLAVLAKVPADGWHCLTAAEWGSMGLAVVAAAFVFVVTPLLRDTRPLVSAMPFVALATIGTSALALDVGTLPLVVLPSMLLGRQLGRPGVLISGAATALLVTLPAILAHGRVDNTIPQMLPLPIVAMVAAATVAVWLEVARAARRDTQRALTALQEERRTSDAFLSTVDVGLQLVDTTGRGVVSNKRMEELQEARMPAGLDDAVGHVYGADCTEPITLDDLPSTRGARGEEFDGLRIWVGEVPAARRALSVNARNVYDETGRRTGSALAYQDVTELMRALRVKDEFIGLVSHELRTPLTSIYGYVAILSERDDLPEQVSRQLAVVSRSTDRLKLLVDDLLEATQVAGTGMRIALAPCLLAEIVANVVLSAQPNAVVAGVDLRVVLPEDDPVEGDLDEARIAQVVDNLVANAIKYTPAGGRAEVRLTRRGDLAELLVSDSGIGIREEDLPRVFGRFYRTQEAAEQAIQGLGLGLSITRTIVEAHGGKVEVASRFGEGSTFRVLLPLGEDL